MPTSVLPKTATRLKAIMAHIPRYTFSGQARLAEDAGVSRSAISRMLSDKSTPSMGLVMAILTALETHLGRRIDPRELVSLTGSYPTPSVCELCGCMGCMPEEAYDRDDTLRPEYRACKPGEWCTTAAETIERTDALPVLTPDTS